MENIYSISKSWGGFHSGLDAENHKMFSFSQEQLEPHKLQNNGLLKTHQRNKDSKKIQMNGTIKSE